MVPALRRMSGFGVATLGVRGQINLSFFAFLVCVFFGIGCRAVMADAFKPIRERLVFSTDMTPIDLEVVGSTSLVAQFHQLIPELVLRFRLPRAFVDLYAEREPGYELLSLGVDLETASPIALFEAVQGGPRFGKDIPGIPKLPPAESRRRNIVLSIHSDARAEYLRKFSDVLVGCRGQAVENELWVYVQEFSVGLNFDRDLLARWQELISFSSKFLKSKQYQPIGSR